MATTATGIDVRLLTDDARRFWHGYDYGWRRIALQNREDKSPIDPDKAWFNAELAARAEIFWSKELGIRAPDLPTPHQHPTADDIAHVAQCCREIRANLNTFLENTGEPFK